MVVNSVKEEGDPFGSFAFVWHSNSPKQEETKTVSGTDHGREIKFGKINFEGTARSRIKY